MTLVRAAFLILAVLVTVGTPLAAQEVGAGITHMRPTGRDLADGSGFKAWIGRSNGRLRLGFTMVEGRRIDPRSMCAGLIAPGESCGDELSDTRATLRQYALGYSLRRGTTNQFALIPSVGLSDVRSHTESRETDGEFDGRSVSVLGSIAGEFSRRFHAERVGLSAGIDVGAAAARPGNCADCRLFSHYDGYQFASVYLTASFRLK